MLGESRAAGPIEGVLAEQLGQFLGHRLFDSEDVDSVLVNGYPANRRKKERVRQAPGSIVAVNQRWCRSAVQVTHLRDD